MLLTSTSDIVRIVTGSAGAVAVHASWVDNASGTITPGRTNTASITTATTTTVVGSPGSSTQRNTKRLKIRNTHASVNNAVTVQHYDGTISEDVIGVTLLPGESLVYDGTGVWTHYDSNGGIYVAAPRLDVTLRVTSDVVNATTSMADVTGLTYPLKASRNYVFEAHLYSANNASTTGSQFAVNIGAAPNALQVANIGVVTTSVTAAALSAGQATARDTAVTAQTTGSTTVRLEIMSGYIQPSADGTFAVRCASEVAVAAGITVKAGSWLRIRETDN